MRNARQLCLKESFRIILITALKTNAIQKPTNQNNYQIASTR